MNKLTLTITDQETGDEKFKLEVPNIPDSDLITEGYATPGIDSIVGYLQAVQDEVETGMQLVAGTVK